MTTPFHPHSSSNSDYLGSVNRFGKNSDLYYDPQGGLPTVIARFGPDEKYYSGLVFVKQSVDPGKALTPQLNALESGAEEMVSLLATATRLSVEKGLLDADLKSVSVTSSKNKLK